MPSDDIVARLRKIRLPDMRFPKPTDPTDDDYLIVWSLIVSFGFFAGVMFILWWRHA